MDDNRERPEPTAWAAGDARSWIAVPTEGDDKYARGVLGMVTGSARYPGAAVLGAEAAARTGVGMVRYLGPPHAAEEVLRRRPEIVAAPGRVQAWLIGSGMSADDRSDDDARRLRVALDDGTPLVIDAGALDLVTRATGPVIITPHYRELAVALAAAGGDVPTPEAEEIRADPGGWAERAASALGVTVLLKGHTTHVVAPGRPRITVTAGPAWLATAGSGDVLGGMLGALVATHADAVSERGHDALAALAATAAWVHGRAGESASQGGPVVALDVAEAVPGVLRQLLAGS
ncbi:ADP-dependent NAD(P)H-hydrate dehydratase [Leifsonia sp. McL0607]|uniref:ADP-dependent NAD(P)H-hydrate dehydratase n=1 Tax=Leifsonia sp. McL0607 TaxID=3415672 RepID=UPI003CE910E9